MESQIKYLLSLRAIRDRANLVWASAESGRLSHFEFHKERLDDVADFVLSIIQVNSCLDDINESSLQAGQRDFGPDRYDTIPPHGRWQHFEVGGIPRITLMIEDWKKAGCEDIETTRRLIDLFFVSVLLDAGAGDYWRFIEPQTNNKYERSEGIAVASLHMFTSLSFANSKRAEAPLVDGNLT